MHNINEGLGVDALEHLISPMVSLDQYESKISDRRVIVVGLFVAEEDPANDLSNFIDRSSYPILDTEVSPSPTPEGYYVVFVEIQRDEKFPKILIDLLDEITNLCKIDDWNFVSPENPDDPLELNLANIKSNITLDQDDILELPDDMKDVDAIDEGIDFWKNVTVDSIVLENNIITFRHYNIEKSYAIIDSFDDTSALLMEHDGARYLQRILGSNYAVLGTIDGFIVEHLSEKKFLKTIS
jgi:hypothetical protein